MQNPPHTHTRAAPPDQRFALLFSSARSSTGYWPRLRLAVPRTDKLFVPSLALPSCALWPQSPGWRANRSPWGGGLRSLNSCKGCLFSLFLKTIVTLLQWQRTGRSTRGGPQGGAPAHPMHCPKQTIVEREAGIDRHSRIAQSTLRLKSLKRPWAAGGGCAAVGHPARIRNRPHLQALPLTPPGFQNVKETQLLVS